MEIEENYFPLQIRKCGLGVEAIARVVTKKRNVRQLGGEKIQLVRRALRKSIVGSMRTLLISHTIRTSPDLPHCFRDLPKQAWVGDGLTLPQSLLESKEGPHQ